MRSLNAANSLKLQGQFVDLEQINQSHREELRPIAQDPNIFTYFTYHIAGKDFDPWFEKMLLKMAQSEQLAFAVRCKKSKEIVGSTRFYDIALQHRRLKIGHTWYTQQSRGTAINPESKFLLLQHAFEKLVINRVEFMTDSRNTVARAAIKKLGAMEEGIMRQHMIFEKDGYVRDTVLFSIIKSDWPEIKEKLLTRIKNS